MQHFNIVLRLHLMMRPQDMIREAPFLICIPLLRHNILLLFLPTSMTGSDLVSPRSINMPHHECGNGTGVCGTVLLIDAHDSS